MTENDNPETSGEYIPTDEEPVETEVINFNINDANIAEAAEAFRDVDAYKDLDGAKKAKKFLTKMRTTLSEAHKEEKAEALAHGRRLDAEKNRLLASIGEIEDPITADLKAIKEKAENEEAERVEAIEGHLARLESYSLDRHDLTVDQIKERRANLAQEPLTEEIYQEKLDTARRVHEESDSKLRIVLIREEEAVKEREEQARIAEENAARQKELDKRQAEMDAADAERQAEQDAKDAEAREEQNRKDAERQAELDAQAKEQAAEKKELDDEKERIEQQEQKAIDDKAADDAAEAERVAAAARAPDRDKLLLFAESLDGAVVNAPIMQSEAGANTMRFAAEQLTELADTVRKCVEEMK